MARLPSSRHSTTSTATSSAKSAHDKPLTEWLAFLKQIDREAPDALTLHLIIDNYATPKPPKVNTGILWRNRRFEKTHGIPRIVLYFTPTSSSWMNLRKPFFPDLTNNVVRDGSFERVRELAVAIESYLGERDLRPKRYVWKAQGQAILKKIERTRRAIQPSIVSPT